MVFSGRLTLESVSKYANPGERLDYVQILVVKCSEIDQYKANCPRDAAIFVLPDCEDSAYPNGFGVGFARYHTKKLATYLCPTEFPYCFMMDDSVQYWVGVTLANDTQRFFDREPGYTAQTTDISLADVLTYFQLQPDIMKQFGMFGFYRFNGWLHERAYDRTHCTKAILLNLDKLKDIDYEKGAHTWEDLKLSWDMQGVKWQEGKGKNNEDCDTSASISCKLYRFQVSSPQLHHGGCAHMVARPDAPVGPEPVVPEPKSNIPTTMENLLWQIAPSNEGRFADWIAKLADQEIDTPADLLGMAKEDIQRLDDRNVYGEKAISAKLRSVLLLCKQRYTEIQTS
jgi:hypothetical protein